MVCFLWQMHYGLAPSLQFLPVLCTDGLISRQIRPDFDTICTCFADFLTRWSAWWQTEHGFAGKVYSVSTWWCNATRSTVCFLWQMHYGLAPSLQFLPVLCTDGLISRQIRPDFSTICTCFADFLTRWSAWWQTEHSFAGKVYSASTWWCNATRSTQVTVALTHRTHLAQLALSCRRPYICQQRC